MWVCVLCRPAVRSLTMATPSPPSLLQLRRQAQAHQRAALAWLWLWLLLLFEIVSLALISLSLSLLCFRSVLGLFFDGVNYSCVFLFSPPMVWSLARSLAVLVRP